MTKSLFTLLSLAGLLSACSPEQPVAPVVTIPSLAAVKQRLEVAKRSDPNRALCEKLTERFGAGDTEALRPLFDHKAFVERVIARGKLPPDIQADLRARANSFKYFGQYFYPEGSRFLCLGTRPLLGEPHVAIRQWTPTKYDYVLFRLSKNPELPIDDFFVVSGGSYHSEGNALAFTPGLQEAMKAKSRMLDLSYEAKFAEIIDVYRTLPPELQASPVAFSHFINAVFTQERGVTPLYQEAVGKMATVFRDSPYTLAYWRISEGVKRRDKAFANAGRIKLSELLDDYMLAQER